MFGNRLLYKPKNLFYVRECTYFYMPRKIWYMLHFPRQVWYVSYLLCFRKTAFVLTMVKTLSFVCFGFLKDNNANKNIILRGTFLL